ncbi:MAG: hypothetical protein AAGA56_29080 [Myxococcota bacterium]
MVTTTDNGGVERATKREVVVEFAVPEVVLKLDPFRTTPYVKMAPCEIERETASAREVVGRGGVQVFRNAAVFKLTGTPGATVQALGQTLTLATATEAGLERRELKLDEQTPLDIVVATTGSAEQDAVGVDIPVTMVPPEGEKAEFFIHCPRGLSSTFLHRLNAPKRGEPLVLNRERTPSGTDTLLLQQQSQLASARTTTKLKLAEIERLAVIEVLFRTSKDCGEFRGGRSGSRHIFAQTIDHKVSVYDRRSAKKLHEKTFRAKDVAVCSKTIVSEGPFDQPSFVTEPPTADELSWLRTLP